MAPLDPGITSLPEPSRRRLARCLGMLGSDHDGEVVAAARAIGRELQRHSLGLTDLAAFVEQGRALALAPLPRPEPSRSIREQYQAASAVVTAMDKLWGEDFFTEWECSFARSVMDQLRRQRKLTDKQAAILNKLLERITPASSEAEF